MSDEKTATPEQNKKAILMLAEEFDKLQSRVAELERKVPRGDLRITDVVK